MNTFVCRTAARVLTLALVISLTPPPAESIGLSMKFVDITLENVDAGASFNLRVLKNLPLVIINQDKTKGIDVLVESVLPNQPELKPGYEPMLDPTWVKILPERFSLGPGASASADIVVSIPNDPKLVGRHFETIIWAHTVSKDPAVRRGVQLQVGLRARLRMSIGTIGPESLEDEKLMKKLALVNTNFSIRPDNSFVQNVPVGKTIDLKKDKKASLKIINESDDPIELLVKSVSPEPNNRPQAGYEDVPDPKWIKISPAKYKVLGSSIKEVSMQVTVPDKPEYRGKKYMFLLQTSLANESLPLAYYNMVYITTEP